MAQASAPPQDLSVRDPRVGDRLNLRNAVWRVTERSTYDNEEGYRCVEWTCEAGSVEAYLLKEAEDNHSHKWFFTLTIDEDEAAVPAGGAITEWIEKNGKTAPPPTLLYRGQSYRYGDKTDGTYADDSGGRTQKTTWDYWDAERKNNLAVEIWASGEVDAYLGRYIAAADAKLTARPNILADHDAFSSNGLKVAAYGAFFAFYVLSQIGGAFDHLLTLVLGGVLAFGWFYPVLDAPKIAAASAATAAALAFVFWNYPPFTHPIGLAFFFGAPAGLAWLLRKADHSLSDKAACVHIAYALEIPLIAVGLVHYFRFAPAPHDFIQYCLALTPALVGGVVAWGVTTLMFSRWGPDDAQTPPLDGLIR
jgi:hypothetical protein